MKKVNNMDLKNNLLGKFYKLEVVGGSGEFYKKIERVYNLDNMAGFAIKLSNNTFIGDEKIEKINPQVDEINQSLVVLSYREAMELTNGEGK